MAKKVVDVDALLALNPEFAQAVWDGEPWALKHLRICESLNAGEHEGFRRPFDGTARKWCGAACPHDEGCVMCTLPDDPQVARHNREWKNMPPDPMMLAKQGVITIAGEISFEMVRAVQKMIAVARQNAAKKLEVRIESHGGMSFCSLEICGMIQAAQVEKRVGVVKRYAYSGAAVILQACDWRVAAPGASLLIHQIGWHPGRVTIDDLRDPKRVQSLIAGGEPEEKRILKLLMERTGRSEREIKSEYEKESQMTAQQALAFGLIDAIRD